MGVKVVVFLDVFLLDVEDGWVFFFWANIVFLVVSISKVIVWLV